MNNSLVTNPTTQLLERMAVFGERRHEVLAGNIANISTPDYRMRDLPIAEFKEALKQAVAQIESQTRGPAATTDASNDKSTALNRLLPERLFEAVNSPEDNLTFHDANNRSVERQTMELTKNSMMQNFVLEVLRFQMNALQSVISERP